jgi:hypothetical protein
MGIRKGVRKIGVPKKTLRRLVLEAGNSSEGVVTKIYWRKANPLL